MTTRIAVTRLSLATIATVSLVAAGLLAAPLSASAAFHAGKPVITGVAAPGSTIHVDERQDTWSDASGGFSITWMESSPTGYVVAPQYDDQWTLTAADLGHTIYAVVEADSSSGAQATANTPAVTVGKAFAKTTRPKIKGTDAAGKTLKVAKTPKFSPHAKLSYQWYLDETAISHATKKTLKVKKSWVKHQISVIVTAKKSGYAVTAVSSYGVTG